jgi:hypothetical protein
MSPVACALSDLVSLYEDTLGPAESALDTCSATTSWMGYVGCKLLSQKYSLTGTPQEAIRVSGFGVPLHDVSNSR